VTQTVTNIRLPGVYFLPPPRSGQPPLPPLDVTGFVGFAQRGPVDTPVRIDDLQTYTAIFGGDLAVAREAGGRTVVGKFATSGFGVFRQRRAALLRRTGGRPESRGRPAAIGGACGHRTRRNGLAGVARLSNSLVAGTMAW